MTMEPVEPKPVREGQDRRGRFTLGNKLTPEHFERSPSLVTALKRYFRKHPDDADFVVKELVRIARRKGNQYQLAAIKEIFDRIDGRATETHKVDIDNQVTLLFAPAQEVLADPTPVVGLLTGAEEGEE